MTDLDIDTVELVGEFLTSSPTTSLALHPDETQLAVGTEKGQIRILVQLQLIWETQEFTLQHLSGD